MTNPIVGIGELLWDMYPDGRKVAGGAAVQLRVPLPPARPPRR